MKVLTLWSRCLVLIALLTACTTPTAVPTVSQPTATLVAVSATATEAQAAATATTAPTTAATDITAATETTAPATAQATPIEQMAPAKVRLALDWTPNTNHIGFYVADALGLYRKEGIRLKVIPYATTAPETLVSRGRADFGVSYQAGVSYARAAGACAGRARSA